MQRSIAAGFLAVAMGVAVCAGAQEPERPGGGRQGGGEQGGGRGAFAGMQRVQGLVTAVSGDTVTVKAEDGMTYQVTTTANTRVMKAGNGQPATIKVSDVKAGDGVTAMGNLDAPNKTLHAGMLFATDAEQLKKLREDLGKKFISGKVTAIDSDNLKMTVLRTDGVSQTIGFDETTSFKKAARGARGGGGGFGMGAGGGVTITTMGPGEGESITLADIKVGDNVVGQGSIKGGVFVPGQLVVTPPRPIRPAITTGDPQTPKPQQ